MSENNFKLKVQAVLDKVKSVANIKADIKTIEAKLPKMKIRGTLDSTSTRKELNSKLKAIKPKVKVDADTTQAEKKIKKIGKQKTNTTITPTVDTTQVVSGLKKAQKEAKSAWSKLGEAINSNLIRMSVQKITQAIHEAILSIKELDTIKTNIQMAAGIDDSKVNSMMRSYNQMAKDLSSTTREVGEAANSFVRMGESLQNTEELIKNAQMLSKIGMTSSQDAASYLISAMKGYKIAAEDSISIVDKLTSVDTRAAVSSAELAEAMSKTANLASSCGVSMDNLIGYIATVAETTQKSATTVGTSFQSLFSRMANIKLNMPWDEETGESLSDVESTLGKLGIRLRTDETTYRSFDDVLKEIAGRWKEFNEVEKRAVAKSLGGTQQRENTVVLIENLSRALELSEVAANSAGSALARYSVFQDSIEAKTNELTAAIESISTNMVSEELYSGIIQATTGLVEFLDKTNLLKTSLMGLITMGVSKAIVSIGTGFTTAAKSTAQLTEAMALLKNEKSEQNLLDIGAACKGLSDKQLKLILSTKGLVNGDREKILAGMDVAEAEQQQTLATLGFAAAEDKAIGSTFSLRGAFRALGTAMAANPIGAVVTAVSAAVMAFSAYGNAVEETRQKAQDFGDEIQSTKSEIEGYKERIGELQDTINNSSSSFDDVSQARKDLMAVQDELIQKFGSEKEAIEAITQAIAGQSDALELLTQRQYQQWKNEFNSKSLSQSAGDFLAGGNIANAFHKLTELDLPSAWDMLTAPTESNMDKMVDRMQHAYYKIEKSGNDALDSLIAKTYDLYDTGSDFVLSGNLSDIYEDLLGIQEMSKGFNVSDRFETGITKVANAMGSTLNSYKEAYRTYILYEKILNGATDNQYGEQFGLINKAKEAYDGVLISGDGDKIRKASDEYARALQSAIDMAMQNSDVDVADYFKSMYPELQQMFGEWQFSIDFEPNTDGLKDKVADALDAIDGASDGNTSFSVEDIENFNPNVATQEQIDAYGELTNVAETYGLTVKQLITLLQTMGLIQSESYQQLVDAFGQDNVDKLSPEDLEIAYTIKNVGTMTFEQFQAEIQKKKEATKEPVSLSISSTIDQLNTQLKPAFDSLKSAYNDIFTDDGSFALNSIDILSTCDSIKSKLDDMEKLGLKVDYSSYEDFVRVLRDSESTEQDVKDAFDSLAASITDAGVSGAEDFGILKSALEDLGVVNEELVAFEALISNTEALKEAGIDLANVTDEQISAFANEMVSAGNASQAIAMLKFQKELYNMQLMNTAGEVANLRTLAENAGYTGEVIKYLTELEQIYQEVASGTINPMSIGFKIARATMLHALIKESAGKINYEPKVDSQNAGGGSKSASKAGKEAADAYLESFEKELKDLDDLKDRGKITEKQYLDALRRLYLKYFRDKEKYLKEYEKYEKQYLDGMKSLYESAFSYITKQIDRRIDAINDQKDATVSALEAQRDASLEEIELKKEQLENEQEIIDKKIKGKQEAIDAIEKEIDAMQEANKERKREIDLQKAKYDFERMLNQRTSSVYKDGQMVWQADTSGIRDAKQEVEDAQLEVEIGNKEKKISLINEEIGKLEKEKDLLQERIDLLDKDADRINKHYDDLIAKEEQRYDAMVKGLEDYKSQFEELTELLENAQMEAALSELGINMDALLSGSQEEFEKLKTAYIGILADMSRGNDEVIGQLSRLAGVNAESVSYLESTKGAFDSLGAVTLEGLSNSVSDVKDSAAGLATSAGEASNAIGGIQESVSGASQSIAPLNTELEKLKKLTDEVVTLLGSIKFPEIGDEGYVQKLKETAAAFGDIALKCAGFSQIDFSAVIGTATPMGNGEGNAMPEGDMGTAGTGFMGLASAISDAVATIQGQMDTLRQALDIGNTSFDDQIKKITEEYLPAWEELQARLAGIIGVGGSDGDDSGKKAGNRKPVRNSGGSESGGNGGSIIDIMQTGGEEVASKLNDPWLKAFNDFATDGDNSIQSICRKIVDMVSKMKDSIQDQCAAAANSLRALAETIETSGMPSMGVSVSGNTVSGNAVPVHAKGTVGKAYAKGTGGYKGLPHDEKNALRSEYGQPELTVYPDGKAELTTKPTMGNLPKGTVIFNEEQTSDIIKRKGEIIGDTFWDGTEYLKVIPLSQKVLPYPMTDPSYHMMDMFIADMEEKGFMFMNSAKELSEAARNISRISGAVNNNNNTMNRNMNVDVGGIHVHGVQNPEDFSDIVAMRAHNRILQEVKKS